MDSDAVSSDRDRLPAYSTSKQVQAWFLRRSRDRWKSKHAELQGELKRLRQRVADLDRSRARWRARADAVACQLEELRVENARLQAQVAAATDAGGKNAGTASRRG